MNQFVTQEEGSSRVGRADEKMSDKTSYAHQDDGKSRLADFIQYPKENRKIGEFLEKSYQEYQIGTPDHPINRLHGSEVELGNTPTVHRPGNITPLMREHLNMLRVEGAFAEGLQHTKTSIEKAVNQRVDEIDTLLRGAGGFNRQIRSAFARNAVLYLEREDPSARNREKILFTVNISNSDLKLSSDDSVNEKVQEDGRSRRRVLWDNVVNILAEVVSDTGLKPKFVKNDKNNFIFTVKQDLLTTNERLPDEYFAFELCHLNTAVRDQMIHRYVNTVSKLDKWMADLQKKSKSWLVGPRGRLDVLERLAKVEKDRDFYVATHPDPREMDTGLVFTISLNSLKDYSITKEKMRLIMSRFISEVNTFICSQSNQEISVQRELAKGLGKDFTKEPDKITDKTTLKAKDKAADRFTDHGKNSMNSQDQAKEKKKLLASDGPRFSSIFGTKL